MGRKRFSTKSILLLLVVAGSSAVAYGVAYGLNNTLANARSPGQDYAPGGYPGRFWGRHNASSSFVAISRVDDVTVTGFNIASTNQVSVNLSYAGTGTAPAITIVAMAPELSGSNTLAAGWVPRPQPIIMVGEGSLSTTWRTAVLIVPYTGA